MVTTNTSVSESFLLWELIGDRGNYRWDEMEEESGSELNELKSSEGDSMEVEEEWKGKSQGRPNFKCAIMGAGY